MKKLIIAANMGKIRVLKYHQAGDDPCEQDHLLEEHVETGKNRVTSIQEAVTDQAGRFAQGSPAGMETGMSYGEEHHLKSELDRTALKNTVSRIESILEEEGNPDWILAAPQPILGKLVDALPSAARGKLSNSVGADLTRVPLEEMEERFL